jgi:two-component system, sensor histidine kinase PdtaS
VYLEALTTGVLKAFNLDDIKVEFKVVDVAFSPEDLSALGILLTELLTNSCKYTFEPNKSTQLAITLYLYEKQSFIFTVNDFGIGFDPDKVKKKSFGLSLIEIQAKQLGGNFEFKKELGFAFGLVAPLRKP